MFERLQGPLANLFDHRVDARADVEQQDDGKRQFVLTEMFDLLFGVVLKQLEVLKREIANDLAGFLVGHQGVERDQIGLDLDGFLLLVFRLRESREREKGKNRKAQKLAKDRNRHSLPPTFDRPSFARASVDEPEEYFLAGFAVYLKL